MKPTRPLYWFLVTAMYMLGGCAPQVTTADVNTETTPESGEIPITSGIPKMEVGSTYLYADGTVLVAVPAGPFTMGGGGPDNPEHQINLSEYWFYSTKVTKAQYAACVAMGGCTPPQFLAHSPDYGDPLHGNEPIVGVNYEQAQAYCNTMGARLPTEAEWEKAARGPDGNIYPWGDAAPNCELLNFEGCVGSTTPVNNYPDGRSYYAAFDMEGNTLEWVADKYQPDYYLDALTDDPKGPDKGKDNVVRASAFNSGANQTQTFSRFHSSPETVRDNLGFRCVVEDPTYFAPFCEYPLVYGTDGIGGSASGPQPEVDCPPMAIHQNPYCVGDSPQTDIYFVQPSNALPWTVTGPSGSCYMGQLSSFTCNASGTVTLCGTCRLKVTTPPQCPTNYTYDGVSKKCLGRGTSGACLPGSTLIDSPSGQCCAFLAGTPAPTAEPITLGSTVSSVLVSSPSCPAGTYPYYNTGPPPHKDCISVPVEYPYCISESIQLNSCTPGGGGGDAPPGGCPTGSCEQNYAWDPSTCSCVCDGC